MENMKNTVFGITKTSINSLVNMFGSSVSEQNEESLEDFAKTEYKEDWQWALSYYKNNKSFPRNYIKY